MSEPEPRWIGHEHRPNGGFDAAAIRGGPALAAAPRNPSRPALAALGGLAAAASLVVTWLADSAGEHDALATFDPRVAADVVGVRSTPLTALAHALTWLGSEAVVGVVAVVVLALLLRRGELFKTMVLAAALGGSAALTLLLKFIVARPRPGAVDRLGAVDTTWSFPSGHTLNSTVLLVVLTWLLWRRAAAHRVALVAFATAVALGVGASRIYLGYHWTTDVLASVLVATAWLSIVALLAVPTFRLGQRVVHHRAPTPRVG